MRSEAGFLLVLVCILAICPSVSYSDSSAIRTSVERRLKNDIAVIRGKVSEKGIAKDVQAEVSAEVDGIAKEIANLPTDYGNDFRAVLPLNPLHARLFRTQARLWQAKGHAPFTLWTSRLWDPLSHMDEPPLKSKAVLRVDMMRNEYRAAAFNVSNATEKDAEFALRFQGLPGGANPDYIAVHEVAWTDTNKGLPVAAAMPPAERKENGYLIHVPSGMTRQVWLTFNSKDIDAGNYRGRIEIDLAEKDVPPAPFKGRVAPRGRTRLKAPLTLRIYPLDFPERPTLHFGGWDYTDLEAMYGVTPKNRPALVAHLKEHFVDSPWGTAKTLPFGKYDNAGRMTEPPDTSHLDAWLQLWTGARQYCVFSAVSDHLASCAMGTPEFENAVNAWATFWAAHIREKGLTPEQFAVLLVDEPQAQEQDAVILAWAKAIRAADTGIRIWEDPIYKNMDKANQEMVAACHVLCPNRQIFLSVAQDYRDYFVSRRERGTTLEFYSCSGPVRLLDPYSYHRLQAWTCWEYGATASYFWAFGDTGGASCWNEYATERPAYTPLFLDADSVTAGKHLEACREGIEDYEYLLILKRAVEDATRQGAAGKALDRARNLLAEAPRRVKASSKTLTFRWHNEALDRSVADEVRVEILEALMALADSK
jgi:hypothetical protein